MVSFVKQKCLGSKYVATMRTRGCLRQWSFSLFQISLNGLRFNEVNGDGLFVLIGTIVGATLARTFASFVLNIPSAPFSSMAQMYQPVIVFVTFAIGIGVFIGDALVEAQPSVCFDRM